MTNSPSRSELLEALDGLGITRSNHRVLGLLPLVYVAWADGKVRRGQRRVIERLAAEKGWLGESGGEVLAGWLETPPSDDYVRRGLEVLQSLAAKERGLGAGVDEDSLEALVAYGREVAEAASGLFGMTSDLSKEAETTLDEIAKQLGLDGSASWQQIADRAAKRETTLPPGPDGHPLVGNVSDLLNDPLGFLLEQANRHGDVVYFSIGVGDVYLLRKPEHVEHVLRTHASNYQRGADFEVLRGLIGESLLTTDGETWRKLRRLSQPAFRNKALVSWVPRIAARCARMLDRWAELDDGAVIDIVPDLNRLTLEVIGELVFSKELGDDADALSEAVSVAVHHANQAMSNPLKLPQSLPTPSNLRFERAVEVFDGMIYAAIAERRKRRARGEAGEEDDLLALLMAAEDAETGERLSDEALRNEMLTFLVAGHETTTIALMWIFYALSTHPAEARRAVEEIDAVLGGETPTYEQLEAYPHTNRTIDEAMRKYPPVWLVSREAQADDVVGGYRIPKGALVFVSPWVTQHDPEVWPNPEGFDPERFIEEAVAERHRDAYFPFAVGPHKCIGVGLAMMELRTIVPMVLQRFRLDLEPGFRPKPLAEVTLRSENGMRMALLRRD